MLILGRCLLLRRHDSPSFVKNYNYNTYRRQTRRSDYYELLGIEETATPDEIKQAFYTQSKKYHPDLVAKGQQKESEQKFLDIKNAYETLKDLEKRAEYDRQLVNRIGRMRSTASATVPPSRGKGPPFSRDIFHPAPRQSRRLNHIGNMVNMIPPGWLNGPQKIGLDNSWENAVRFGICFCLFLFCYFILVRLWWHNKYNNKNSDK